MRRLVVSYPLKCEEFYEWKIALPEKLMDDCSAEQRVDRDDVWQRQWRHVRNTYKLERGKLVFHLLSPLWRRLLNSCRQAGLLNGTRRTSDTCSLKHRRATHNGNLQLILL